MNKSQFRAVLEDALAATLERMRRGFLRGAYYTTQEPTPEDVNDGYCNEYAVAVANLAWERHRVKVSFAWVKDLWSAVQWLDHCIILWEGEIYDAQALNGVSAINDLPIVQKLSAGFVEPISV